MKHLISIKKKNDIAQKLVSQTLNESFTIIKVKM